MNASQLARRAITEVDQSDEGHLPLPTRRAMWQLLGALHADRREVHPGPERTLGDLPLAHRKRLALLALLWEHFVRPVWAEETEQWARDCEATRGTLCNEEDRADEVIRFALDRDRSSREIDTRADRYANFMQYAYEIWPVAPRAALCMEFARGVLSARLYDLIARDDDDDEEGSDRWFPDVYACWAFAGSSPFHAEDRPIAREEIQRRRRFWHAYSAFFLDLHMLHDEATLRTRIQSSVVTG